MFMVSFNAHHSVVLVEKLSQLQYLINPMTSIYSDSVTYAKAPVTYT